MNHFRRCLSTGLLLLISALVGCSGEKPLNLLVITLDTTRADYLGCYGRETARTPNLDRLAGQGCLFETCFTAVPLTTPSHSTIFTGTYPLVHGVRDNGLFVLPEEATTLAEILRARGYATGAAVGSFPVTQQFGLAQGFDYFNDHITVTDEDFRGRRKVPSQGVFFDERPAAWVNDAIMPWLDDHAQRPFFAWIHYWDAHQPHHPPAPFDQIFNHDLYQGEIAYVDQSLGAILKELEQAGVDDRTVIVVVGDHGEGLGEHLEDTHSMLAYNATLHVPLIVRVPGLNPGVRIRQTVGTVDIVPTVLDLLGLDIPAAAQGRSLAPMIRRGEGASGPKTQPQYYAETLSPRLSHGWGELRALFDGRFKYIHGPRIELFDLEADPKELHNLASEQPQERERMKSELVSFLKLNSSESSVRAAQAPDQETMERLAALGYVSAGGESPASVREELRSDGVAPQDRIADNSLVSTAKQQLSDGNFLAAKESALRLVALDPDNPHYQGLLAIAYLGLGLDTEATRIAEQAQLITAQNEPAYIQVAAHLFNSGSRQRGLELAERIVHDHATATGAFILAEMYAALSNQTAYFENLEKALDIDPTFSRARLSLAILVASQGQTERAEQEFSSLVREWPLTARFRLNYGVFLAQSGRLHEALPQLERATQLSPTYWQAQLALLAVHVDLEDEKQAQTIVDLITRRCRDPQVNQRAKELAAML